MNYKNIKILLFLVLLGIPLVYCQVVKNHSQKDSTARVVDLRNGEYRNPIIFADYSDPDVIQVNDSFYMVSSSFNCVPALPILYSKDLVNWKIVGHIANKSPDKVYDSPQHGKGVWAPSIRFHNKKFWIFYGDPDLGIFMSNADSFTGVWKPLMLVKKAKGWIDPCPLWDDDGSLYIIHAWAKSRVGFNSILTVNRMSPDGMKIYDDSVNVFDGHDKQPTIEGPKFYKRNGYYYIFAPAGGVEQGWQTVLRSKNVFGPYEDKIVLQQGNTKINGPHQGAWIDTENGESWFIHFQDLGLYGRIIHLQPMIWKDDWPVIGIDKNNDGIGEPVLKYKKPILIENNKIINPQTSDEFNSNSLGLQWQWQANFNNNWFSLTEKKGSLRLYSVCLPEKGCNLWKAPNLLLQKIPAPEFSAITMLEFHPQSFNEIAGMIVMGMDYSFIGIKKEEDGFKVLKVSCMGADRNGKEVEEESVSIKSNRIYFKISMADGGLTEFCYSPDNKKYISIGKKFQAKEGKWIGAKIGIFNISLSENKKSGYSDFDWFRIN
jgi:beta-xylosidase